MEQQTPRPIKELWELPCPPGAVILGKGPSLGKFDPDEYREENPGHVVWGVNETVEAFDCDYGTYQDEHLGVLKFPSLTVPVRKTIYGEDQGGRGYVYDHDVEIPKRIGKGTPSAVLYILGVWGLKENILMVGFDGWDGPQKGKVYWEGLNVRREKRPRDEGWNYGRINKRIKAAVDTCGLTLRWFHREIGGFGKGREMMEGYWK